jgi:hypothetical protein
MEAWRRWRSAGEKTLSTEKAKEPTLTPSGLLMEGDFTQNQSVVSIIVSNSSEKLANGWWPRCHY